MKANKNFITNLLPVVTQKTGTLQLSPITVKEEYLEKWNSQGLNDFVCLTIDGQLVNEHLFRVGGMNDSNISDKNYFMLLKYNEAFYDDIITTDKKRKPYLQGVWCIINKKGEIKVESKEFNEPYLVKNSCIYFFNSDYYNIETGYHYCKSYTKVESNNFLFLENSYDDDLSRRGVMKINKLDGTFEIL